MEGHAVGSVGPSFALGEGAADGIAAVWVAVTAATTEGELLGVVDAAACGAGAGGSLVHAANAPKIAMFPKNIARTRACIDAGL